MASYVRGTTLFFSAAFVNKDGDPATPASANLYLVFTNLAGVRTTATVAMTISGNVASAQWDSAVAADGIVQWSVRGAGSSAIVKDGNLTLTANEANPIS